jgi:hypothetical protein
VPINLGFSQVFKIGDQAMSFQIGGKYYAEAPEVDPNGEFGRLNVPLSETMRSKVPGTRK